jgi:hypothetical protein
MAVVCSLLSSLLVAQAVNLHGRATDPIGNSAGKPVVLVFVSSNCPISSRYAPEIQRLSGKYQGKIEFWLVYPSRADTAEIIRRHFTEFGYKLPALRDPDRVLVKRAQVQITPEAAVFNAHGVLIYHGRIDNWYQQFGRARVAPTSHDLDDAMQAAVNGRMVAMASAPAVGCYIADLP